MWSSSALLASTAAFLLSTPVDASGLYTKNSPVVQVTARNYERLIAKSNHTSIVEFYAPWCGHCKNLKPAFEKAAKNLAGLAKVAAVNCDDDENKQFCGEMGIKGFPTLKIVRPSKKSGRPAIEEYQGSRSAKAIVDSVVERIPNHVTRVTEKSISSWLEKGNDTAKVILFTDKGTTSALFRALAIDFLGSVTFGQINKKEKEVVASFGIKKYPTLVLLPGGEQESVVYSGELKKELMSEFLTQVAQPNPDPAPEAPKVKAAKAKSQKISQKKEEKAEKKPVVGTPPAPIPAIQDDATLREKCLSSASKLCALVLLPKLDAAVAEGGTVLALHLKAVQTVHEKHAKRKSSFPIYLVQPDLPLVSTLRKELGLKDDSSMELIAVNARRSWWRKYSEEAFSVDSVEAWIDTIRMNEGQKETLPESLITSPDDAAKEEGKGIGAKDKDEPVGKKIEHEEL